MLNDIASICDIHNHILFGVDDGAKNIGQSMRMLDIAYKEGIRAIIMTPHFCRRYFEYSEEKIYRNYIELKEKIAEIYPDLDIHLGCEIYFASDTEDNFRTHSLITMAESRYILMEFDVHILYLNIRNAIIEALQYGYLPIIAHVERYECLIKDIDKVFELSEQGAYIQINASSVTGDNGRITKKFVKKLLKYQMVDFVATDAHRDNKRMPLIANCASYIAKKYGKAYAKQIFVDNPDYIIKDKCLGE